MFSAPFQIAFLAFAFGEKWRQKYKERGNLFETGEEEEAVKGPPVTFLFKESVCVSSPLNILYAPRRQKAVTSLRENCRETWIGIANGELKITKTVWIMPLLVEV